MLTLLDRDEFGEKIGLGLPCCSLALIEGDEGTGRSVVSQRLAYGLLQNGHSVTYISTELTLKDFVSQMHSMRYEIGRHMLRGNLLFLPVLPIVGESLPREEHLKTLMSNVKIYRNDVTIIDSLGELLPPDAEEEDVVALLEYWKRVCHHNKTIIVTARPGMQAMERLRQAADQYFELQTLSSSYGIRHLLKTRRYLKARAKVDKIVEFRVEPEVGLIIEITEVSG